MFLERGGYTVHPVAAPPSTAAEQTRRNRDGGRSQKLRLFIRGNARSGMFNIIGINQLPNPPINAGITRKKIIKNAWAVIIVLNAWFPSKDPGVPSSVRIRRLIDVPAIPAQMAIMKYSVPISL